MVVEGLPWARPSPRVYCTHKAAPQTPGAWRRRGSRPQCDRREKPGEGGNLPGLTEASTAEPALEPSLSLSQTDPLIWGLGPCQALSPLLVFPHYSLQPGTLPSPISGIPYSSLWLMCDSTSSRKPSLNLWVGSVPPRALHGCSGSLYPPTMILPWVDLSSLEIMVLRSWTPFNSQ